MKRQKLPKIPDDWQDDLTKLPFVAIEWVDTTSNNEWLDTNELLTKMPVKCRTLGHMLPPTKEFYRLTSTIADHGQTTGLWMIPRQWVLSIKVLS